MKALPPPGIFIFGVALVALIVGSVVRVIKSSTKILDLGGYCCGTADGMRCEVRPMQSLGSSCTCPGGLVGYVCR